MEESQTTRKRIIEAFPETNTPSVGAAKQPKITREKPGESPTAKGEAEDKRAALRSQFRGSK